MKSQEQRVKDAANVLVSRSAISSLHAPGIARAMLEAADREPPKWPTDESLEAAFPGLEREHVMAEQRLRDALLADPIIKAAIAYRDAYVELRVSPGWSALLDAVDEAGL